MENFKAPEESQSKLHFLDYWRIIRIRKTVILAVFLLVAITTTAVTYLLPKSYNSTVRIRVEKDATDVEEMMGRQVVQSFDPYWIQTEFEVIQSRMILDKVIENLDLSRKWGKRYGEDLVLKPKETYDLLRQDLNVRQYRNTSLIEIEVFSRDPQEAADIANEIARVYRASRIENEREKGNLGITVLQEQLKQKEEEVRKAEEVVDKLKQEYNIVDILPDASIGAQSIEPEKVKQLQQLLVRAEQEYISNSTMLEKLRAQDRSTLRNSILTLANDEVLRSLMLNLNRSEQELVSRQEKLTENHPELKEIKAIIAKVNEQIDDEVDGYLAGLETKVATVKAAVDNFTRKLEEAKTRDAKSTEEYRPYFTAKRHLEYMQRLRDALSMKIMQEQIDLQIPRSAIVVVTDPAEPASRHVRPNMTINIALGCIVGLIVGIGLAFFIEYLDTSVKTIDDVERALQAPVLGVIPQNVGSLLDEGPESPHAEAYRVLRTNLLFSRKNDEGNTITIVSGGAGEGKSTTLFNLGTIFAQNGDRVLIVDSDLRRPSIHKILGVSNSIGLTNFLLGKNELEEVIQTTPQPSMDVLPSGKLPSSSLGILNSPRMKELVQELKKRYDYVFFDSPPIMGVSDASILASLVDISVQVIQYRKYPQAMTIRAKQMVEKIGKNLVGIVLNNINMSQDSDYYYYSGYYYDYYYSKSDKAEEEKESKAKRNGEDAAVQEKSRIDIKQKF